MSAEIQSLWAALAECQRRLNALEAFQGQQQPIEAVRTQVRHDEGVRIITGDPIRFSMPQPAELRALYDLVTGQYPSLRPDLSNTRRAADDAREHFEAFASCFGWLGEQRRTEQPETKHAVGFWIDEVREFARAHNMQTTVRTPCLVLAVLAHGDIAYADVSRSPFDLAFGISHVGKPATDAWRAVLATGELREPTKSTTRVLRPDEIIRRQA